MLLKRTLTETLMYVKNFCDYVINLKVHPLFTNTKVRSMSNIKDLIKEKLNQLSKEELVDALADVCAIYVTANINTQLSNANCIQQCVNNVQTNLQQVDNVLTQRLNINFKK